MLTKNNADYFTEKFFHQVAEDMKSGRWPGKRVQHADNVVTGLRAQIFPSSIISYHVQFYVGDERPFMLIGYGHDKKDPMYLTVEEARNVARTIVALGRKGINPQMGLLPRLIHELKRDGENWKLPKFK
jgi:hypothetical protein